MSVGVSLLAVAALWKLLRSGIGLLRRMNEDATVQRRIQIIRQFQEMGYELQAPFIVNRLLKEPCKGPNDDQSVAEARQGQQRKT